MESNKAKEQKLALNKIVESLKRMNLDNFDLDIDGFSDSESSPNQRSKQK